MKTYIVYSKDLRNFQLLNEAEELIGEIVYPKWYSANAEIKVNNKTYKFSAKGFWTTSLQVSEGEKVLLNFKMAWSGDIVLTDFSNGEEYYQINKEKWYNDVFEMKDQHGNAILKIKRNFKWKNFSYYYEIISDNDDLPLVTILGIVHVVNFFNSQTDTTIVTSI